MKKDKLSRLTLIKDQEFNRKAGKLGETIAKQHLENSGLYFIDKNVYCRYGELDLIMLEANVLVFVEVKCRKASRFGGAIHAISIQKQHRLIRTAKWYMQQHDLSSHFTRFDVVAIDYNQTSAIEQITWIRNAFYDTSN